MGRVIPLSNAASSPKRFGAFDFFNFFLIGLALAALVSAVSPKAFGADNRVAIGNEHYSTGYLPRPRGLMFEGLEYRAVPVTGDEPTSYDSREFDFIPAMRNQGQCGSCWDFATTGALETATIVAGINDKTVDLSEQDQLVNNKSAYGCDGGFMDGTWLTNVGTTKETLCPYKANDRVACSGAKYAKATKWALLPGSPTDQELAAAIYKYKALFVTVAAGGDFEPNSAGDITRCSSRSINHMVQIVAYEKRADGYWFLIKNSWGTSWGDGGYAWSKRGCNKLASESGDAAGYFYIDPVTPPPPPPPPPGRRLELPFDVTIWKGAHVQIGIAPPYQAGVKYRWNTGATGGRIVVQPAANTTYQVTETLPNGTKTVGSVTVKVVQ